MKSTDCRQVLNIWWNVARKKKILVCILILNACNTNNLPLSFHWLSKSTFSISLETINKVQHLFQWR